MPSSSKSEYRQPKRPPDRSKSADLLGRKPSTVNQWRQTVEELPLKDDLEEAARLSRLGKDVFGRMKFVDHRDFDPSDLPSGPDVIPPFKDPRDLVEHMLARGSRDAQVRSSRNEERLEDILTTTGRFDLGPDTVSVKRQDWYQHPRGGRELKASKCSIWWKAKRKEGESREDHAVTQQSSQETWLEHEITLDPGNSNRSKQRFKSRWDQNLFVPRSKSCKTSTHFGGNETEETMVRSSEDQRWLPEL